MDNDIYNRVIEAIYDSTLDPEKWISAAESLRLSQNALAEGFFVETHNHALAEH